MTAWKQIQRQVYSALSSKTGLFLLFIGFLVTINSVLQLGDSLVNWRMESIYSRQSIFQDNIAQSSFQDRLCLPVPIDIVYTWVNGSDPKLMKLLEQYKLKMEVEKNQTTLEEGFQTRELKSVSSDKNEDPQASGSLTPNKTLDDTGKNETEPTQDPIVEKFSKSRFNDNGELQYSLRSIQKYAPWARRIFIVTNGQIPNWLNLNHPKITLITHDMIFPNQSHLPTFSSPAIEAHLHRIPGISKKFIYLNDDVLFGEEVWPDDFYTHSDGQKVFLSWPVPNCAEGCPSGWIGDGYCDKACNVSDCNFDNGDCIGGGKTTTGQGSSYYSSRSGNSKYCTSSCPDSWVGDRYCDRSCNVIECGFDGGDCGFDEVFVNLPGITLTPDHNMTSISLPNNTFAAYFNMTSLFPEGYAIEEGSHDNQNVIRTAAFSKKNKIMSVTFHNSTSPQDTHVFLTLKSNDTIVEYGFIFQTNNADNMTEITNVTERSLVKIKVTMDDGQKYGSSYGQNYGSSYGSSYGSNYGTGGKYGNNEPYSVDDSLFNNTIRESQNKTQIPLEISEKLYELKKEYEEDILTRKGYFTKVKELLKPYDLNTTDNRTLENETTNIENGNNITTIEYVNVTLIEDSKNTTIESNQTLSNTGENLQDANNSDNIEKPEVDVDSKVDVTDTNNESGTKPEEFSITGKIDPTEEIEIENVAEIEDAQSNPSDTSESSIGEIDMEATQNFEQLDNSEVQDESFKSRQLNFYDSQPETENVLPQRENDQEEEKEGVDCKWTDYKTKLDRLTDVDTGLDESVNNFLKAVERKLIYLQSQTHNRKLLLDTFGESLRYVNMLYNKKFGSAARKVPAHMPHMIDVDIMKELQETFPAEFEETSSHRFRDGRDMQFSFSYFYFLMGVPNDWSADKFFSEVDTDSNGKLNSNEMRTLAVRLFGNPLNEILEGDFNQLLANCSVPLVPVGEDYDVKISTLLECPEMFEKLKTTIKGELKYKFQLMDEKQIAFHMIRNNHTKVRQEMDGMRKQRKKFVCLNDNIDHTKPESEYVVQVLQEIYMSYFPTRSDFELPEGELNEYLYYEEFIEHQRKASTTKAFMFVTILGLSSIFCSKCFSKRIKNFFSQVSPRITNTRKLLGTGAHES